jgi:hypothetical protein
VLPEGEDGTGTITVENPGGVASETFEVNTAAE